MNITTARAELKFRTAGSQTVYTVPVPVVWVGSGLVVHRPGSLTEDGFSLADKGWEISHLASGMQVAHSGSRARAEQFARHWDERLHSLTDWSLKGMQAWPHFKALQQAVRELR